MSKQGQKRERRVSNNQSLVVGKKEEMGSLMPHAMHPYAAPSPFRFFSTHNSPLLASKPDPYLVCYMPHIGPKFK